MKLPRVCSSHLCRAGLPSSQQAVSYLIKVCAHSHSPNSLTKRSKLRHEVVPQGPPTPNPIVLSIEWRRGEYRNRWDFFRKLLEVKVALISFQEGLTESEYEWGSSTKRKPRIWAHLQSASFYAPSKTQKNLCSRTRGISVICSSNWVKNILHLKSVLPTHSDFVYTWLVQHCNYEN